MSCEVNVTSSGYLFASLRISSPFALQSPVRIALDPVTWLKYLGQASVLQVAEAGASLATTLYNYAKSVKSAEKDINKIAREVSLPASVLQHTHDHLKGQSDVQTCSERAIHDLEDLLAGCKEAFKEVENALTKSMRPGANGAFTISVAEKLKWPLRSTKLEVLRAHLEKLKSTLLLMLTVLALGSKIARRRAAPAGENVDLTLERLQIQSLIHAKEDAADKYAELTKAFSKLEKDVKGSATDVAASITTTNQPNVVTALAMPSTITSKVVSRDLRSIYDDDVHPVVAKLELCASAVSRLTSSIDAATKQWHSQQVLEHESIATSLREASQTIKLLQSHACGDPDEYYQTLASRASPMPPTDQPPTWASYIPTAYSRPIPMPPPDQPLTSATYIPDSESFGPGMGIPPLRVGNLSLHQSSWLGSIPSQPAVSTPSRGSLPPLTATSGHGDTLSARLRQHLKESSSPIHGRTSSDNVSWPVERVQIWLVAHGFSKEWQAALQQLSVCGDAFLDIGRREGQKNHGFMIRVILPQIARQCALSGVEWDQSRERDEGKRLRRLVREVVRVGVQGSSPLVARLPDHVDRRESLEDDDDLRDRPARRQPGRRAPTPSSRRMASGCSDHGHFAYDCDDDPIASRHEQHSGSETSAGRMVRGTLEEGGQIVEAGADGEHEDAAVEDLLRMWTTVAA